MVDHSLDPILDRVPVLTDSLGGVNVDFDRLVDSVLDERTDLLFRIASSTLRGLPSTDHLLVNPPRAQRVLSSREQDLAGDLRLFYRVLGRVTENPVLEQIVADDDRDFFYRRLDTAVRRAACHVSRAIFILKRSVHSSTPSAGRYKPA